jgi:hypothetical protein
MCANCDVIFPTRPVLRNAGHGEVENIMESNAASIPFVYISEVHQVDEFITWF